ncbi:MFS transporter [Halococcus salifodinae]|uniref:Major Facilitator Superfamily transporter n=1 Tax=Halococcus salifodinae DSM 8989 TaxID=1227456 RepID=M0MVU2_9EURY|nr:MFS transporter [Halococcus salifodinae]EMA49872.1 Major Facilitator Superfamily transporter [Halococcus salifodinae DSM 8989]
MRFGGRLPSRLVLKYYIYQATTTFGFFWPVFTLFLLSRGLSYTEIGLLSSLSAGATVVGEVPTGYVGDRLGRRNSLVIGAVLLAVSLLGFVVVNTFWGFAVLWVLWGLGGAFQSGSADAWLYDALETHLDEAEYTRVRGRGGSVNQWVSAATMLTAGGLYSIDHRLPFLAGALLVLSIPVVLSFPRMATDPDEDDLTVFDAVPIVRERLTAPPLRSLVLYVALFFAIIRAADEFIQPIATRTLSLPATGLGPLYAGFTVIAAIASYFAGDIEDRLSTRGAVLVVPVATAILFVVPAFVPLAAFPLFFGMKSSQAVLRPIVSGYINDHVESLGRATVLSAASLVYAVVRLPLRPVVGWIADLTAPIPATALLGGGFLASAAVIYRWGTPASTDSSAGQTAD